MLSFQRHLLEEVKDWARDWMRRQEKDHIPPTSSVRLLGGRLSTTSWRPEEPSWNAYESDLTCIRGACSFDRPSWVSIVIKGETNNRSKVGRWSHIGEGLPLSRGR